MIQEKRGMLKHWNMALIILTYSLVIFGTFLTRSGVLSSVHAFAQSNIGPAFFLFIGFMFVASAGLLLYRWPELKSEAQITSTLSREALFLLNNMLFMCILAICFLGVVFPLLTEASGVIGQTIPSLSNIFNGQKVTVGPVWYETTTGPLFAALVMLMGVAPLSAWGHSTARTLGSAVWKPLLAALAVMAVIFFGLGIHQPFALIGFFAVSSSASITLYEFWRAARARGKARKENLALALWRLFGRNRRRYGGYLIHLSIVLMAIGIIGIDMFQTQTQQSLAVGQSLQLDGYSVRYDSLAQFPYADGRYVTRAVVSVFKNDQLLGELYPRVDYLSGRRNHDHPRSAQHAAG